MRYVGAAIGAAGALGVGGAAEAQDWSVTPRYWYYFDNINQRESAIDPAYGLDGGLATLEGLYEDLIGEDVSVSPLFTNAAGASDQMSIPLTGGTIAFDIGD